MKKYCDNCKKEVEVNTIIKRESYNVYGEEIEVDAKILVCAECEEELFCEELDTETLNAVYKIYREKHKLLFPAEIREIREQYGLSQRSFARILNWGDKTICRYENGSIQDKAHNSLLLLLREPANMRRYLTENEVDINEKQKNKLLNTIDNLEKKSSNKAETEFFEHFFSDVPSEENGYRGFDYEKFCAMVLFFANKKGELLKTKLMKLLNYADMVFYKENGISISGMKYVHLPFGPVPDKFDIIFGKMATDEIAHIDVVYDNGYEKHRVIADNDVPKGILNDMEIEMLQRIYDRFALFGSAEISEYSHKEKGYKATKKGEVIPYSYAKYITLA